MQSKIAGHASMSTRRIERTTAIVAIALIPIAIILSYRAGLETTTTGGVVLALLASSGLLAFRRASWRARSESHGDSRAA
jgi:hypothetical protein